MQKKQFGRSMIEMLGVLAIIGVLSIGGLLGYRRAVNNHQANTILDDVNRFAFVILERSGLALDAEIDKGDFVESGIYNLKGYQSEEAQGFSITVQSVPKGVCEALLPKAVLEYKVGIVTAGGSVNDEIIYDTLNTDLCKETSDIAFYFGDTSGVCNEPDESGYTPCTTNADCCGGEFCVYVSATNTDKLANGNGRCETISEFNPEYFTLSNGQWARSRDIMNGWSAYSFCNALGMSVASRTDIGCTGACSGCLCSSDIFDEIVDAVGAVTWHWLEEIPPATETGSGYGVRIDMIYDNDKRMVGSGSLGKISIHALCH